MMSNVNMIIFTFQCLCTSMFYKIENTCIVIVTIVLVNMIILTTWSHGAKKD